MQGCQLVLSPIGWQFWHCAQITAQGFMRSIGACQCCCVVGLDAIEWVIIGLGTIGMCAIPVRAVPIRAVLFLGQRIERCRQRLWKRK